jgi:hypothetical protein
LCQFSDKSQWIKIRLTIGLNICRIMDQGVPETSERFITVRFESI